MSYDHIKPELRKLGNATYSVSTSKADGFVLHIKASSLVADTIVSVSDKLCDLTRHHFCVLHGKIWEWAMDKEVELASIPIDREMADKISWSEDSWSWLDPDPDDDKE